MRQSIEEKKQTIWSSKMFGSRWSSTFYIVKNVVVNARSELMYSPFSRPRKCEYIEVMSSMICVRWKYTNNPANGYIHGYCENAWKGRLFSIMLNILALLAHSHMFDDDYGNTNRKKEAIFWYLWKYRAHFSLNFRHRDVWILNKIHLL